MRNIPMKERTLRSIRIFMAKNFSNLNSVLCMVHYFFYIALFQRRAVLKTLVVNRILVIDNDADVRSNLTEIIRIDGIMRWGKYISMLDRCFIDINIFRTRLTYSFLLMAGLCRQ